MTETNNFSNSSNRYKIAFDGNRWLKEEFYTKDQIIDYISNFNFKPEMLVNIGYVVDPARELKRHFQTIGKNCLQDMATFVNPNGKYNITEEINVKVGKLILEKVIPEIDFN